MYYFQIDGSWLTHINIDGKKVFNYATEKASIPIPIDNPLPSDCRYRRDLNFLKDKDLDNAQLSKVEMEEIQRRDAKLRKHAKASTTNTPAADETYQFWLIMNIKLDTLYIIQLI